MKNDVERGIYWGALCDECAGSLTAESLLGTYATFCLVHGLVGLVIAS
jgi:hypothetical protein